MISHHCYFEYHWTIYTTFINTLIDNLTNSPDNIKIHAIEKSNVRIPIFDSMLSKNPRISYSSRIMITNNEILHPYYNDIKIKLKNEELPLDNDDDIKKNDNNNNCYLLCNLCIYLNNKKIKNDKLEIGVVRQMSGIVSEISTF